LHRPAFALFGSYRRRLPSLLSCCSLTGPGASFFAQARDLLAWRLLGDPVLPSCSFLIVLLNNPPFPNLCSICLGFSVASQTRPLLDMSISIACNGRPFRFRPPLFFSSEFFFPERLSLIGSCPSTAFRNRRPLVDRPP